MRIKLYLIMLILLLPLILADEHIGGGGGTAIEEEIIEVLEDNNVDTSSNTSNIRLPEKSFDLILLGVTIHLIFFIRKKTNGDA